MLRLFGRPTLTDATGGRIDLPPTGWRLLAALAAGPEEGVGRAELAALLLPTAKLSTLRKLVWDVRRALEGAGLDLIAGDAGALRLSGGVYCDLRDLRAARPLRAPSEIYRGAFFEAGVPAAHPPWAAWLARQRDALRDLYVSRASAVLLAADADRAAKAQEARHLLKHAPDHAAAARVMMAEAARAADPDGVRQRFGEFRATLEAGGRQPDRRTTDMYYRFVGEGQRQLAAADKPGAMDFPTIYVSVPAAGARSRAARLLRSLMVDLTIGLCRASLFRVIASDHAPPGGPDAPGTGRAGPSRHYEIVPTVVDHVAGRQIVFALLSFPSAEILWTERVEAVAELSVEAYNLLTAGVLRSLVGRITDLELDGFRLDADPSAYSSYLAGYSSLASLDLIQLRRGRNHLRRAMSRSPDFAPITSALARSLQREWLITGRGEQDLLSAARDYALRAIAADPCEARGFQALAFCDLFGKRFDAALENYAKAEQLNRHYADLLAEHADCLIHCGMLQEALEKIDFAMQLNPEHGDMYIWIKASVCFLLSRYDEVIELAGRVRDGTPALRLLAATYALMGRREEARSCRMKALANYPSMTIEGWIDTIALRDPEHIRFYSEGLSKAGFS